MKYASYGSRINDEDNPFRLVTKRALRRRVGANLEDVVSRGNAIQASVDNVSQCWIRLVHLHERPSVD